MKRIVSSALCVLLMLALSTALAGSAGTSADPLISLSYINDTLSPAVRDDGSAAIDAALGDAYNASYAKLEGVYSSYMSRLGTPEGYLPSGGPLALELASGASVTLLAGSCFTLTSGNVSLTLEAGAVIDLSTGTEMQSGSALSKNVRYLCAESSAARFTASSFSSVVADGYYKTSGTVTRPLAFKDVSASQWFYGAVSFVFERGYMTGIATDEFGVSMKTTRAVFVTALYRLAGSPAVSGESVFSDVTDPSSYYYSPVIWSNQNGIITGHDDGTFRPGDSVTREQMAAIMYRFAGCMGYNVTVADESAFNSFPDCSAVNAYAVDAMKWAAANRIINGMDGALNPGGTAIRAQVAQIIWNFCEYLT